MNLFYRTVGEGEPVIIIHGLYGASDNWMQIARKMPNKYQFILVDLRNHGASPHSTEHTYEEMVTDIAWLFHELEIEKAHVMGHSMGGKVAIAFAADYPEKIKSLTVADIAPRNYLSNPASAIQYDFHKHILQTLSTINLEDLKYRSDVDGLLKSHIPEVGIRQFILKNLQRKNDRFEWKINVSVLKQNLDHIISAVDWNEYSDRIPITQYPVLFLKGELSGYIRENDIKIILTMYSEAIIKTIEDATHFLHAEKPDKFVTIWSDFLEKVF